MIMSNRFLTALPLLAFSLLFATTTPAFTQQLDASQLIAECKAAAGERVFKYQRCLIGEYERLEKQTRQLTDKLLGMVGGHRAFGRLKILQWSNAISKSQSRWHKFIVWDCEWGGHARLNKKGAAAAMTKCRIERTAKRVKHLENRVRALDNLIKNANQKD